MTSTPTAPFRATAAAAVVLVLSALGVHAATAATGTTSVSGPTGQTLTVTPVDDLDPTGATVTVTGSGYDTSFGIYVALCVDNGPGVAPSPCVGGIDPSGGGMAWVSSNPPPYGVGLAIPYGTGGTFSVDLTLAADDGTTDCADGATTCAVVTRADHVSPTNRAADVRVPITWDDGDPGTTTTTGPSTTVAPTSTTAIVDGPSGERSATGPTGQLLTVAPALELDPAGAEVRVTGSGYDPAIGIYVALCLDNGPDVAPSPCLGGADQSGSAGASAWISDNPPPYGVGVAQPFGADGSFDVTLDVRAADGSIDCYDPAQRCVVATRADHTAGAVRTADVKVPVLFVGQTAVNDVAPVAAPAFVAAPAYVAPAFTG